MTKIDIISGFLGAGKTTLIKKLLKDGFPGEKVVLIENEFGEIGIDGVLLKDYGIEIREMNSGCICCTISGDFSLALKEMLKLYQPDRIIIEPSGVGKLSDVILGCRPFIKEDTVRFNMCITVIDGMKYKMYLKNFSEFYKDQLKNAGTILLSRTQFMKTADIEYIVKDIRNYNETATLVTTDWDLMDGQRITELAQNSEALSLKQELLGYVRNGSTLPANQTVTMAPVSVSGSRIKVSLPFRKKDSSLEKITKPQHHHADDVFDVWGMETVQIYSAVKLREILNRFSEAQGFILRGKGILMGHNGKWFQFDYVPGEITIKESVPDYTGRICVIGEKLNKAELTKLFEV